MLTFIFNQSKRSQDLSDGGSNLCSNSPASKRLPGLKGRLFSGVWGHAPPPQEILKYYVSNGASEIIWNSIYWLATTEKCHFYMISLFIDVQMLHVRGGKWEMRSEIRPLRFFTVLNEHVH